MSQKENIFRFNHIDKSKTKEKIQEIKELYKYYHFKYWCYQKVYKYFKKLNLLLNMTSSGLIVVGAVAGGLTANPAILGSISGAGLVLKTFSETKNYNRKIEMARSAYTSYDKTLVSLRPRGGGGGESIVPWLRSSASKVQTSVFSCCLIVDYGVALHLTCYTIVCIFGPGIFWGFAGSPRDFFGP